MSFLAPWALLLAAGAAVPLVLHLLRRRTGTRVAFPALRYLERAQKEHAAEVRLRNLALMLVRIAIVLAIAMAAARPLGWLPGGGHAPTAMVIVIDNSMSTSAADRGGPVLAKLVRAAQAIVRATDRDDAVWVVTMDGDVRPVGADREAFAESLADVPSFAGAGDASATMARGFAQLAATELPARALVVLTDAQVSTWARMANALRDSLPVAPTVLAVAPMPVIVNRAVTALELDPRVWSPRGAVRATVESPPSDTGVAWRLVVDGRSLARGAQAGAGVISARAEPRGRGWMAGQLELAPDELRGDDVRHFAVRVGEPPAVEVDASAGVHLRGAVATLESGGRVRSGRAVLIGAASRARRPGLLFAPRDPLEVADANRALQRAGVPWRFGARQTGSAPLRGAGIDGAMATQWFALEALTGADADTLVRVGNAPWMVAGPDYVLVASAADPTSTDLPLRAQFLPWLDRVLHERLALDGGLSVEAAPGAMVRVPAGITALEAPDASRREVRPGDTMRAPSTAGVWFFLRGVERAGALVVNPEPAESQLIAFDADSLATKLGATSHPLNTQTLPRAVFGAAGARALDTTLLWLAFALIAAELVLARRSRATAKDD